MEKPTKVPLTVEPVKKAVQELVKPKKPLKAPFIVMAIITALSLIVAGYFGYQNYQLRKQISQIQPTPSPIAVTPSPTADPTADWNTHKAEELSIEFKYPKNVSFNKITEDSTKLSLFFRVKDLGNYEDGPLGFDLKTATSDNEALKNGNLGYNFGDYSFNTQQLIRISNIPAKTYVSLQQIEICNVQFTRGLIFFKDNHQIILSLSAPRSYGDSMPEYFTQDATSCGNLLMWESKEQFYNDLVNNSTPQLAQNWYNLFDQIISTFNIQE